MEISKPAPQCSCIFQSFAPKYDTDFHHGYESDKFRVCCKKATRNYPETQQVKLLKNIEKNILMPPQTDDFLALFHYFWDHGVGNHLSKIGLPQPWTEEALESAFDTIGIDVSLRSVQNWRSGNTRPSRQNIHVLAKIAGGGDIRTQKGWSEKFLAASRRTSQVTPLPRDHKSLETKTSIADVSIPKKQNSRVWRYGGLAFVGLLALTLAVGNILKPKTPPIKIFDVKFCVESDFSQQTKRCSRNQSEFPRDFGLIYVSFETDNVPYGHPFERRWYHEGVEILRRDGFFDEAWENYTWIKDIGLKGPGEYALRIIVDGQVTTETFQVAPGRPVKKTAP